MESNEHVTARDVLMSLISLGFYRLQRFRRLEMRSGRTHPGTLPQLRELRQQAALLARIEAVANTEDDFDRIDLDPVNADPKSAGAAMSEREATERAVRGALDDLIKLVDLQCRMELWANRRRVERTGKEASGGPNDHTPRENEHATNESAEPRAD